MSSEDYKEEFTFDNCHVGIIRNNGKLLVGIEYGKPFALIILSFFIEKFGQPIGYEDTIGEDSNVYFLFNDSHKPPISNDLVQKWKDTFSLTNSGVEEIEKK